MTALFLKLAAAGTLMAAAAATTAAPPVTYAFTKATDVTYHMVHPLHQVKATTHTLRGKVTVADGKLVTPLTLTLPLVSFDSGNANRDANALLALEANRFPSAKLTIDRFTERSRTVAGAATELAGDAVGTVTVHGVPKPVTIPLKARVAPDALIVDAEFVVSLSAHGIPRPSLLFKPVEDAVRVVVHGVAAP